MEKGELLQLVRNFDQFVQLSLNKKNSNETVELNQQNQVQNYMVGMEKRLKLRPPSNEEKFEKLLKPMKNLKSFVSVKEFMQKLGTGVFGKSTKLSKTSRNQEALKREYQNLRGGFYLQKIEEHLRQKNFKRRTCNGNHFITEIQNNPLQQSEYKSWMESTLGKISPKCQTFFSKSTNNKKEETSLHSIQEQDCLIEEHKKCYAEQFKVVPHIRELCHKEYQDFTKISSLLTGRLRKLLKSNCAPRSSVSTQPIQPAKSYNTEKKVYGETLRKFHKSDKQNRSVKMGKQSKLKRVQTAGNLRKQEMNIWKEQVNSKLKAILGHDDKPKNYLDLQIIDLE